MFRNPINIWLNFVYKLLIGNRFIVGDWHINSRAHSSLEYNSNTYGTWCWFIPELSSFQFSLSQTQQNAEIFICFYIFELLCFVAWLMVNMIDGAVVTVFVFYWTLTSGEFGASLVIMQKMNVVINCNIYSFKR